MPPVELAAGAPPAADPAVSVVICAYSLDRRTSLIDAVASVRGGTRTPREVIVVIDHNDELLAWCRRRISGVRILASDGPRGLAGARNAGVRAASGEIVAFLDDDARAEPDWLDRLVPAYGDPAVLGVGGEVRPAFERERPRWLPDEFDWVVGCSYRGLPPRRAPVRNLIGANMSFRREAVLRAGGFRTGFGRTGADCAGCEETELCIRLSSQHAGAVFLYEPAARVVHHVPAERATLRYFVSRCRAEGHSKARVARACGVNRATHTERGYVGRRLPAAAATGLLAGLRGEVAGPARAGAIALGLMAALTGFLAGAWR